MQHPSIMSPYRRIAQPTEPRRRWRELLVCQLILIAPVLLSLTVLREVVSPRLGADAWSQTSVMALVLPLLGLLLCAGFGVGPWMAKTERWLHRQLRWSVTATWLVATVSALVTSVLAATGHCG